MTEVRSRLREIVPLLFSLLLTVACSMVQPTSAPLGTDQNPVKLALAPATEPQKVLVAGQPLVKLLEAETGLRIKLSVPTSYAATIEAMGTHNLDVAWLAPLAYVLAHDRVGADILVAHVRGGSTTATGQIVVRRDSGITGLEGLRGKRIALPDEASLRGYHLPRALLMAEGLNPLEAVKETDILEGSDRVALAVYTRMVDGGAIVPEHGARVRTVPLPPDLFEHIQVIASTAPVPNDVVGIRRGASAELGQTLRDGLLRVAARPAGATALRELYGAEGLGPVTDAEFASLRAAIDLLDLNLDAELARKGQGS